ncbi:MAG: DUF2723 domain-containing protein [Gemmatimonadales bacterium]
MTDSDRPPYRAAALAGALVLAGYIFSLAPSVTFWDAGEFIASMKILGIPHPPGTPLFILMGHVWGNLIPVGEFAWRTNLLSACFSAAAAGVWFLTIDEVLGRLLPETDGAARRIRRLGALAASVLSGYVFTNWQNSNETEVYAVAAFIVAAVIWLCLRWRAARDQDRGLKHLVLIAYLLGVSVANHLLALLAGPAVIAFLIAQVSGHPAATPALRRREWAQTAVVAGLWLLLLGVGLGNATIAGGAVVVLLGCLAFAATSGALPFGLLAVFVALIGVTPYLFLYLRSPQGPFVNEAAPGTWDALLAVIQRAQYPPRSPLDDPTFAHGPDNPGRNLTIIGLQLLNYIQYFDWQWAKTIGARIGALPVRTLITALFFSLGFQGLLAHRRADRSSWWLLFTLWGATGLGLMAYMNFKPGFSVGWKLFPEPEMHEVRERDYFFVLSFVVWGCWAAIALAGWVRTFATRLAGRTPQLAYAGFLVALIPPIANYTEADRARRPDARLAGDFAYDLLNSVPPYGVLFTYGDNDTFPLWWAQEVAGIRQDVRVVCLALSRTDWYMRQLRDNPERDFNPDTSVPFWKSYPAVKPTWPLHTMTDEHIRQALPQRLGQAVPLGFGRYRTQLDSGTVIYPEDIVSIRILQQNFARRPIGWGLTSATKFYGLEPLLVQRGLGIQLDTVVADTSNRALDFRRLYTAALDVPATDLLVNQYRYADLLTHGSLGLESTAAGIANTLGMPLTQLAFAAEGGTIRRRWWKLSRTGGGSL